jgi:hypothetical protein
MPTPENLPDELPENFEIPEDWEPPEGWEPPPEWDGKYPFDMPPVCENVPPAVREVNWTRDNAWTLSGRPGPLGATQAADEEKRTLEVPDYTMAVGGYLNVSRWQGSNVEYRLSAGNKTWSAEVEGSGSSGGVGPLGGGGSNPTNSTEFKSHEEWPDEAPPWGTYTLTISSEGAIDINGTLKFYVLLACGGRFS